MVGGGRDEKKRKRERERESRKRTRGEKGRKEAKPNWAATKLAIRGLLGGSPTINNNAHQVCFGDRVCLWGENSSRSCFLF